MLRQKKPENLGQTAALALLWNRLGIFCGWYHYVTGLQFIWCNAAINCKGCQKVHALRRLHSVWPPISRSRVHKRTKLVCYSGIWALQRISEESRLFQLLRMKRMEHTFMFNLFKPSGNCGYHMLQESVTLRFVINLFRVILNVNSDYFLKRR
jgi:hypothetical protein